MPHYPKLPYKSLLTTGTGFVISLGISIISACNSNITVPPQYEELRDLLAAEKWKEADQETAILLVKIAGKEREGWLDYNDCHNFSKGDLRFIDQLWLKYSNGKFGFSVQKQIWLENGKLARNPDYTTSITYQKVAEEVGWKKGGRWLDYNKLTFNSNAPRGHLPARWLKVVAFNGVGGGLGCWMDGLLSSPALSPTESSPSVK